MATYRDVLAALQATTEGRIFENTQKLVTGQQHQDHEKEQNQVMFDNLLPLKGDNYIIVRGGDFPTHQAAGDALLQALEDAKLVEPNGSPIGYGNELTIIVMPGTYDIGDKQLVLDIPYLNLQGIGELGRRDSFMMIGSTIPKVINNSTTKATLEIAPWTFNTVSRIHFENNIMEADAWAFKVPEEDDGEGNLQWRSHDGVMESVVFSSMYFNVGFNGLYTNCHCLTAGGFGGGELIGKDISHSGTFIDCVSGSGYIQSISCFSGQFVGATFKRCKVLGLGFRGPSDYGSVFEDCTAMKGFNCFGEVVPNVELNGTYIRCSSTDGPGFQVDSAAEVNQDGKFIDCSGGDTSFTFFSSGGNCIVNGTFERCKGGDGSFTSSANNPGFPLSASMDAVFKNCTGGSDSFKIDCNGSALMNGSFDGCTSGTGSFACVGTGSSYVGASFIDCTSAWASFYANSLSGGAELSGYFTRCRVERRLIGYEAGFNASGSSYSRISGRFTDCQAGRQSFGATASVILSGTFKRCSSGDNSFGQSLSVLSGSFEECTSGNESFGFGPPGGPGGTLSGTFTKCKAGSWSFGCEGVLSGIFNYCEGGDYSFGKSGDIQASSMFNHCVGKNLCFGVHNRTVQVAGTFNYCIAGDQSFGVGVPPTAVVNGTFNYCKAGNTSFAAGNYSTFSGKATGCIAGSGSFASSIAAPADGVATASGTFIDCVAGNASFGSSSGSNGCGRATGVFIRCRAGAGSFGSNGAAPANSGGVYASGYFEDCIGGPGSFGGHLMAEKRGKFVRCSHDPSAPVNSDAGPLVSPGVMESCSWRVESGPALVLGDGAKVLGGFYKSEGPHSFGSATGAAINANLVNVVANAPLDPNITNTATTPLVVTTL